MVRVVDVDEKPVKVEPNVASSASARVGGGNVGMSVKSEPVSPRMAKAEVKTEKGECAKVTELLEESMRALSLGKK